MKEFDMNNNEMNEQNNNTENTNVNADSQNTNPQTVNTQNTENQTHEANENVNAAEVNNSTTSVPENHRTESPYSRNPYFEGFSQNNQSAQNGQQNPYNNPNGQYSRYTQNSQYGYNPQQNQQNPQNQQNAYNYSHTYNAPYHSQGQISYTPNAPKAKKEKKSKPVTRGALAAVVALSVLLSGGIGYGSAMLASRNVSEPTVTTDGSTSTPASTANSNGGNVVIYRSVDEVKTSTGDDSTYTTAQVAAMVKDSVVEINTEYSSTSRGWYNYVQQGAGSGVIISTDGYIITNCHVITDEDTGAVADSITVRLTSGDEYDASVVGYDSEADIAIIKIEATGLTAAQCGNSDDLAVGEDVMVVGNPLGELGGTVTNGIVSATQREIEVNGVKMNLIQTNAAVNPGNSGGGMFNMKGQLIGIVNAKSSGTGIEGLGFAIPVNEALNVSEQLLEYGYVRGKTMIGVSFSEVSSNSFYFYYNIKAGVYVDSLTKGYNDDVLKPGDRVVAVNGNTVSTVSEIKSYVTSASVGDKLTFQIERDGKLMEVEVKCFEKVPDAGNNIEFSENNQSETTGTSANKYNGSYFGN